MMEEGYAGDVMDRTSGSERLLLIDTCGDGAAVGLSEGLAMVGVRALPDRAASAHVIGAVRALLEEAGWTLAEMDGVGVVSGPGSFTGVRTGLATAKGLCEATGLRMAAASRLEVLAEVVGLQAGFALLNAGRDEVYVREVRADGFAAEFLRPVAEFVVEAAGGTVAVAEERVAELLAELQPRLHLLTLKDALGPLLRNWRAGGVDAATVEANYVRGESEIYRKPEAAKAAVGR
jgi:tRNA threonylcarbamoyladenosine biosynthesis protein TsaB